VLEAAHWVAAEDTRVSRKLLESQGITAKQMISLHEHSGPKKIDEVIARVKGGESVAYVSDAGTPGVSDPGAEIVAAAAAQGLLVVPIPGPSAPAALLSVAGFAGTAFTFHGFFPREKAERQEMVGAWEKQGGIQIFFESPHRIRECLKFLAEARADFPLVIGRELTKKFETLYRGTCASLAQDLAAEEPRGEYVLALDQGAARAGDGLPAEELRKLLAELAALGAGQKVLVRAAVSHGMAKNEAYSLALSVLGK
jgi:16S rRNA (cytidine1402-2'-O)-methyltransferase